MADFITQESDADPPDTVVIIGNGAVVGGNAVVWKAIAALEQFEKQAGIDPLYKVSSPDVGVYLATLAFVARDYRLSSLQILKERGALGIDRDRLKFMADRFDVFRNTLGQLFERAANYGKIQLRDARPVFRYLKPDEPFGTLSINWDELLFRHSPFNKNHIALHGRASAPATLILPMETTLDDRLVELVLAGHPNIETSPDFQLIKNSFRSRSMRELHDHIHMEALGWLINAKKIILWGVAMNGYDAELISLIPKDDREREVVIINPDSRSRDVAGTLLCNNAQQRVDYDPVRCEEIISR